MYFLQSEDLTEEVNEDVERFIIPINKKITYSVILNIFRNRSPNLKNFQFIDYSFF